MGLTADQFEKLLQTLNTQGGSNNAILIFSGILALVGIMLVVWFVLNLRLKPVEKMEERIDECQKMLASINSKMWTVDHIDSRINSKMHDCIKEHERDCPLRQTMLHKG